MEVAHTTDQEDGKRPDSSRLSQGANIADKLDSKDLGRIIREK